ncbi:MAG: 1-deoxy-D-xylulose-5-phosphate reductoisomerase [Myxococcota bacterium]|nr:1-deoxy-D-xylulose-5-phosphate reductoisomerase [Myxococcota bacterium]
MKRLAVLGSTGSVGVQTLAVALANPDRFEVVALAAGRNHELLAEQVRRFRPVLVSVADEATEAALRARLGAEGAGLRIERGAEGLVAVAEQDCDLVMAALVGSVGLEPTLAAIRAGRDVALANKEVMVMAGALVNRAVVEHGVRLLPVDSEHSAIFQVLAGQRREDIARLVLTCSGGPFRTWDASRIATASIEDALNHPNWKMGAKITIDSATLMNKGLEVIEARWLFGVPPERVEVVVHPESIVHSLVEYRDTSVLAQLGLPDMRVPIAVALAWPERLELDFPRLDVAACGRLHFEEPDRKRFPCLDLAYLALSGSEAAPAVLNASNEVAVAYFLDGQSSFPRIADTNRSVLEAHLREARGAVIRDLADVRAADAWGRAHAVQYIEAMRTG